MFKSFKSSSTALIWQGILAVVVGTIALSWPRVTVFALVILFAVYAFMASGLEVMQAFSSRKAGPVFGHLLLGLANLAAGVIALAWPGPTALVLVLLIGIWAAVAGLVIIVAAFHKGEPAGTRALLILSGLALIAFGVVLFTHPGIGAITIALLFGLSGSTGKRASTPIGGSRPRWSPSSSASAASSRRRTTSTPPCSWSRWASR
jgi:uncharacterized membrane protein HdeD (DUF308 family)